MFMVILVVGCLLFLSHHPPRVYNISMPNFRYIPDDQKRLVLMLKLNLHDDDKSFIYLEAIGLRVMGSKGRASANIVTT